MKTKDYEKLNNFFWFFSLDLKSSKKMVQSLIVNWINNNNRYNNKSWNFDLTSKRVISWLSNHQLSYEDSDKEYRIKFDHCIQKQVNHLLSEIKNSNDFENKMVGCAAIILTGLAYQNNKNYLNNGLNLLKRIIKLAINNQGFPKSRNINQLILYLKYFIIIREWFKESQSTVPEYVDETIYYLGQSYCFVWQNIKQDLLFNGNNISGNNEFDSYLKRFGYKFINTNFDYKRIQTLYSNLSSLSFYQLFELRKNYKKLNYSLTEINLQFLKILSFPFYLFLVAFFSSMIMFRVKRLHNSTFKISLGLFFSVIIYYINNFFMVMGNTERMSIIFAILIPLILLTIVNSLMLNKINDK